MIIELFYERQLENSLILHYNSIHKNKGVFIMLRITNVSQIMLLTDAVYESDKLFVEQGIDSFKPVKDEMNPKRYVIFENYGPHTGYQKALRDNLKHIGDGSAVVEHEVSKNGRRVTIVDMSKIDNADEERVLNDIISNTMVKMRLNSKAGKMYAGIRQITEAAGKTEAGLGSRNVSALKEVIGKVAENVK